MKSSILLLLILGTPTGSPPTSEPARAWHRIAIPGPGGDYRVWGYPVENGIYYEPAEQAAARASSAEAAGASPSQTGSLNFGLLMDRARPSTTTNDSSLDIGAMFGPQPNRDVPVDDPNSLGWESGLTFAVLFPCVILLTFLAILTGVAKRR